jgi:hypothetical protein
MGTCFLRGGGLGVPWVLGAAGYMGLFWFVRSQGHRPRPSSCVRLRRGARGGGACDLSSLAWHGVLSLFGWSACCNNTYLICLWLPGACVAFQVGG